VSGNEVDMFHTSKVAAAILLLEILPMQVMAQETEKGPHCGIVREVGGLRFELVLSVQTLTVYLIDRDNTVLAEPLIGGNAAIDAGGLLEQVHLTAYPGGAISGTGSFPETGPLWVDVRLRAPNGETLEMSFGEVRLKRTSWPWSTASD
jgi:hypothetical protein